MSYPPPEGYPPPPSSQPTVGFPAQPPAAPSYPPTPAQPPYQPASAQPPYQPASVPPPYQPASVQPSAPPAYQPSPAQVSGTPYESPAARRRPTVLMLAVAAAVLLVFGGLMLGLYINERGNLGDTKANLRDTRADLTAQVQEQKSLVTQKQAELAESDKKATDLKDQLTTANTTLKDVTSERDVLVPCMRRTQDIFDAATDGDTKRLATALRQARNACDKAETKVDS